MLRLWESKPCKVEALHRILCAVIQDLGYLGLLSSMWQCWIICHCLESLLNVEVLDPNAKMGMWNCILRIWPTLHIPALSQKHDTLTRLWELLIKHCASKRSHYFGHTMPKCRDRLQKLDLTAVLTTIAGARETNQIIFLETCKVYGISVQEALHTVSNQSFDSVMQKVDTCVSTKKSCSIDCNTTRNWCARLTPVSCAVKVLRKAEGIIFMRCKTVPLRSRSGPMILMISRKKLLLFGTRWLAITGLVLQS